MSAARSVDFTLKNLDAPIIIEPPQAAKSAIIWLHGLGADGHDFSGIVPQLNLPESLAVRFVFPHAPVQAVTVNGGMAMRSWYDIYSMSIAEKMDLASIAMSSAVLDELIEQQIELGIAPQNIIIAGFSQGGLVAINTALQGKHALAGVMALSTYYPKACLAAHKNTLNIDIPVFMAHGDFDPVVPMAVAQSSRQNLIDLGCEVQWHAYPMEHQVCQAEIKALSDWMSAVLA